MDFNTIGVVLTPGVYVEVDNTRAQQGLAELPNRTLLIGVADGTADLNVPVRVTNLGLVDELFGRGVMLAEMCKAFGDANPLAEMWAFPTGIIAPASVATATVIFAGGATKSGVVTVFIAGRAVSVAVAAGDNDTAIATAWADAANAITDLPVTAAVDVYTVTLTSKWGGYTGNMIDVRVDEGASLPSVTITANPFTGGNGDVSLAQLFAAIGDEVFTTWVLPPLADTTLNNQIAAVEAELERRAGGTVQLPAQLFTAVGGTHAEISTWAGSRNSPFVVSMGLQKSPTPPWIVASLAAAMDVSEPDPARPRQTLPLPGMIPPATIDRYTQTERQIHLNEGVATFIVDAGGACRIERLVTTYTLTPLGVPDTSYRDVETLRTLAALRHTLRARLATRFPRYKVADDGFDVPPGAAIVTPSVIRGEVIALAQEWVERGWIENIDQFKRDLVVRRNTTDPNRVDIQLPPDLVNQLRVLAGQIQFRV